MESGVNDLPTRQKPLVITEFLLVELVNCRWSSSVGRLRRSNRRFNNNVNRRTIKLRETEVGKTTIMDATRSGCPI